MRPVLRASRWQAQSGFTLLELLIAMAVTAVLAALSYQSIQFMVNTQEGVEQNQSENLALQRALWWLEQDVVQMVARPIEDGLGSKAPALSFRDDLGLEMTRLMREMSPLANGGLLRVGYRLEKQTLYRELWPAVDRVAGMTAKKVPILEGVERMSIRLLSTSNQWQTVWPIAGSESLIELPKAIEVTLVLANRGQVQRLFRGVDGSLLLPNIVKQTEAQ